MTVIRLDAATMALVIAAGEEPILVCDEHGRPVQTWHNIRPVAEADEPRIVPRMDEHDER